MTDEEIKVTLSDKQTWAEKWLRPIIVASIPSMIALLGVVLTLQNQSRLDSTSDELRETKQKLKETEEALQKARQELESKARDAAREEVVSANETRLQAKAALSKYDRPFNPVAANVPPRFDPKEAARAIEDRVRTERPFDRKIVEQTVAEWAVDRER